MPDLVRVLCIDDSASDFELTRDALARQSVTPCELDWAQDAATALRRLEPNAYHAALLDVRLGHQDGLDVLGEARRRGIRTPFIVLTGFGTHEVDVAAMRAGAVDYLPKDRLEPGLLERAIRYAVERQRLVDELDAARQREARARELSDLERVTGEDLSATARAYGLGPLKDVDAGRFGDAVGAYGGCLDDALDQRAFKVDHHVSGRLRDLGRRLGALGCGPRDVIDVHAAALRPRVEEQPSRKAQAYIEEGRLLLIELMGQLATYYRGAARDARAGRPHEPRPGMSGQGAAP